MKVMTLSIYQLSYGKSDVSSVAESNQTKFMESKWNDKTLKSLFYASPKSVLQFRVTQLKLKRICTIQTTKANLWIQILTSNKFKVILHCNYYIFSSIKQLNLIGLISQSEDHSVWVEIIFMDTMVM